MAAVNASGQRQAPKKKKKIIFTNMYAITSQFISIKL